MDLTPEQVKINDDAAFKRALEEREKVEVKKGLHKKGEFNKPFEFNEIEEVSGGRRRRRSTRRRKSRKSKKSKKSRKSRRSKKY